MEYLKKLGISLIFSFSFLIGLSFIFSILNYINFINDSIFKFIKIFIPISSIFIGGFLIGKKSSSKGWLEGIKFGLIVLLLMLILSFIFFNNDINIKIIFYYLILLLTSITSSMIGINFKKDNK